MYRLKVKPRWFVEAHPGEEYTVKVMSADETDVIYFDPWRKERNKRSQKGFAEKFVKV